MLGGGKNIMDNRKLIVCGDSFSIGIGCTDLSTQPYGSLLSKKMNIPLVNLAKGSSTNFSIYLQARYAVEHLAKLDDIVLVSNTSYDRVDWFPVDYEPSAGELSNLDVNYHQYPPYGEGSYFDGVRNVPLENPQHPLATEPGYTGKMFTENFMGVIDYWETYGESGKYSDYYLRFANEPRARMKTLYDFAVSIHHPAINRVQSIGVLTMAHILLKNAGIRHLILTQEPDVYAKTMLPENLVEVSWGDLSVKYPDEIKTFHTSHIGHLVAYETVLEKIKQNGWL
jgi:hypothetical protein